jgi:hypothetical protein
MTQSSPREQAIADLSKEVHRHVFNAIVMATRTCANCERYCHSTEKCLLWNARPPARTIVEGCDEHRDEVPF